MRWRGRLTRRELPALLVAAALSLMAWRTACRLGAQADASSFITAVRVDDGLSLSISVPRWRFFGDELAPVTLTLVNRSGGPIQYMGQIGSGFATICYGSPLNASLMQDGQSINPVTVMGIWPSCPPPRQPYNTLAEGKSLRVVVPLALPVSRRLVLTAQAEFAPGQRVESRGLLPIGTVLDPLRRLFPGLFESIHAPFATGWPSLAITVSQDIPTGRTLRLARHGHSVRVYGEPDALRHLMVQESSAWAVAQGECAEGAPVWSPLSGAVAQDLSCPGAESQEKWQVLIGAPGYAVTGAVYCFNLLRFRGIAEGSLAGSKSVPARRGRAEANLRAGLGTGLCVRPARGMACVPLP